MVKLNTYNPACHRCENCGAFGHDMEDCRAPRYKQAARISLIAVPKYPIWLCVLIGLLAACLVVLMGWAVGFLADNSKPYPRFDLERREPFRQSFSLCRQLLVGDSSANGCDYKAIEPLQGVKLHVAVIEPESKFVNVTGEMLFAGVMIDTANAAFQQRPDAFNRVRVSKALSILSGRVIHGFVSKEQSANTAVSLMFVGRVGSIKLRRN